MMSFQASGFIEKWYKRDDNAIPPCYTLQPLSTFFHDYARTKGNKEVTQFMPCLLDVLMMYCIDTYA